MRLLFTRFPFESRMGGAEVQTLALMKGLREKGHEVRFLGSCPVLLKKNVECGMWNIELPLGKPPVSTWCVIDFLWRQFSMRSKLYSTFNILHSTFPVDGVFMLSLTEKILLTPLLLEKGIRVIWIEHDRVGRWLTHNPWLPKLRRLSRFVTTIVVSDLSKKIYENLGFQNVIAIPNGIDVGRLSFSLSPPSPLSQRERGEKGGRGFRIGTLARLSYDKGIDVLIEAAKNLSDVAVTIVGTGPEEKRLSTKNYQLSTINYQLSTIRFISGVNNLSNFYHSLDLFVLPSRKHDPFGLVAGEAMLCGIPVIVTDACGIAGYLQNGVDAIIVPAGSISSLREAILKVQQEPVWAREIAKNGQKTARRTFSLQTMVDLYGKVMENTAR